MGGPRHVLGAILSVLEAAESFLGAILGVLEAAGSFDVAVLGDFLSVLEALLSILEPFGDFLGRFGRAWKILDAIFGVLGTSGIIMGSSWAVLGAFRTISAQSLVLFCDVQMQPTVTSNSDRHRCQLPRTESQKYIKSNGN